VTEFRKLGDLLCFRKSTTPIAYSPFRCTLCLVSYLEGLTPGWILEFTGLRQIRRKGPQNQLLMGPLRQICTKFLLYFEKHTTCFSAHYKQL